jgi:hypothetical protein
LLFQCATFRGLCRVPSVYLCRCVDGGQATWLVTNENAHTGQSPFSLSPLCFAANNTQESRLVVQNFNPLFGALGKRQKKHAADWSFMERCLENNLGPQTICSSWPRIKYVWLAPDGLCFIGSSCSSEPPDSRERPMGADDHPLL